VREIQGALGVLALLFGGQQLVAQARQQRFQFALAIDQAVDLAAQRLDLLLAQQRALLGRARTHHADPAGAQAFAIAGDDRLAIAQLRLQGARIGQGVRTMQARQQATDRARPLHLRRERGRRIGFAIDVVSRCDQRQATIAEFTERIDQGFRRIDQHRFDQLAQRTFDRVFPASLDLQALADAGGIVQPLRLQPLRRRALLLAQRCRLQGLKG
jgi:hypothetical protein